MTGKDVLQIIVIILFSSLFSSSSSSSSSIAHKKTLSLTSWLDMRRQF